MDKKNIQDILSLTPTQEGILYHYLKEPKRNLYFIQLCLEIAGQLDIRCYTAAWNFVVKTNEMLRASFRWEQVKAPLQIILKMSSTELHYHDISDKADSEKVNVWEELRNQDRERGFHLKDIPFRITLCKMDNALYQMIISHHHILYDGWSNGIILKEFFDAYNELSRGVPLDQLTPPVKTRFKEFVKWMGNYDKDESNKVEEANFWIDYLAGFEGETAIPLKRKKIPDMNDREENQDYYIDLDPGISRSVFHFASRYNMTPAILFYYAWGLLLQKFCNSDDVIFGTTVSGRSAKIPGIENIVGLFLNTLPLRFRCQPGINILDTLHNLNLFLQTRETREHTPLVKINQYSRDNINEKRFDSIVVVENYPLDIQQLQKNSSLTINSYSIMETPHYDLTVVIRLFHSINIHFLYHSRIFAEESIKQMVFYFLRLIHVILENPGQDIARIEILYNREKQQILEDFNNTDADYPRNKTIHQLFEEQAARTPDNIALVGPLQMKNKSHTTYMAYMIYISYRQLNKKSNQMAHLLRERGIGPDIIVGIMAARSLEMVQGILAILKADGAYLPIDPEYPEERKQYMLDDSKAKILLTNREITNLSTPEAFKTYPKDTSYHLHLSPAPITSMAYIIYTSGSTGKPKGVMVEHGSVVNLLWALQKQYPLTASDTYLLKTSYIFDVSVTELFGWFIAGGRLVILESNGEKDPKVIIDAIEQLNVTHINFVPSMFNVFVEELSSPEIGKLYGLKYIFLAGEALLPGLVNKFKELNTPIALENIYGPTEGTVYSSVYSLSRWDDHGNIPIGKPLENMKLYILDRNDGLQPIEVPGELYIGGKGIARGYLNKPELTAEKFCLRRPGGSFRENRPLDPHKSFLLRELDKDHRQSCNHAAMQSCSHETMQSPPHYSPQHPITPLPHSPIYQTGDLARWLSDGNIEFLGRIDNQVKIRGFRIELGEIENRLMSHQIIKEAVVVRYNENLCAYIVCEPSPEKSPDIVSLREYLSQTLPDFMVPMHFRQLEKIPRTSTGKIDRKTLISTGTIMKTGREYVSPKNHLEKIITEIWKDLLGLSSVGIHDNFFDLGGNSLQVIRLASRLTRELKVKKEIPVVTLFNHPTIAAQARYFNREQSENRDSQKKKPALEIKGKPKGADIAVIGMACRFPGAANIEEFWHNLTNTVESICYYSARELEESGVDPGLAADPNYVPAKGRLENSLCFDAFFFGYTPAEAAIMDPQVRIFHECAWEALEHAGYEPGSYDGLIGVYAGASPNPFWEILPHRSLRGSRGSFSYTDQWEAMQFSNKDYLGTRVGYKLDLKGPCLALQTACSTSLAAVDQACRGLISGACDMALAGGVSITLHDEAGYLYQEGTVMSSDGHCRAFDADANGTVGGNGVGIVVLKPLENARADGDTIFAVIKGCGINNDGKNKAGFTAPSSEGQAKAIRSALNMAGISPGSITYIETHGTGTALGDPIEIQGLKMAWESFESSNQDNTNKKNYCALGSVKSNIGHLDAAAGIAGMIKTVLVLYHRTIPPSLNFKRPNPAIDLENSPFYVNMKLKPWQGDKDLMRAGVSSFGLGGTNVHLVLEEFSEGTRGLVPLSNRQYQLILLSAKTRTALEKMTENLTEYLKKNLLNRGNHEHPTQSGPTLADVAHTLQVGRKALPHRRVLVSCNLKEATHKMETREVATAQAKEEKPTIIFMFSGQGNQYVNMGLDLYRNEPVFRSQVDRGFELLEKITGKDMKPVLYPNLHTPPLASPGHPSQEGNERAQAEHKIYQLLYTTPIKFIFEYSLAMLLQEWGIRPDALIGHSFGEYVAACLSGVFTLEHGIYLAALRGELIHRLPEGAMLGVPLTEQEIKPLLNHDLAIAAVNGPALCVVSGTVKAVETIEKKLNAAGHECIRFQVPRAGHSRMMEPIMVEFKEKIRKVHFRKPQIPYISGLTGKWITVEQALDPTYWTRHLRETIRFSDGLTTLFKQPNPVFLQVGPGRGLTLFVDRHPGKTTGTPALDLVRHLEDKISDVSHILTKIGQLWLRGVDIRWQALHEGKNPHRIPLPTYPFEGNHYPVEKNLYSLGVIEPQRETGAPTLRKKAEMAQWFYLPSWQREMAPGKQEPLTTLIFMDRSGLGHCLQRQLQQEGTAVIAVNSGETFKRQNQETYTINPTKAVDYDKLLTALEKPGPNPTRVIHLWGIDRGNRDKPIKDRVNEALDRGFYSLLHLVRAWAKGELDIVVVTANVHEVTGEEELCPEQAPVYGLSHVIPQEYPQIRCRCIDIQLPPGEIHEMTRRQKVRQIKADILSQARDRVAAYRGDYRWVYSFKPWELEKPRPGTLPLKQGGVYLITGGVGAIGLVLALHLAKAYKAKLILTGRTRYPARDQWEQWLAAHPTEDSISRKIRKLQQIEKMGARVMVKQADVSSLNRMQEVFQCAEQTFGPIDGVIHSAGIVGDIAFTPIKDMGEKEALMHFRPKIYGLLVLEKVLEHRPVDFCMVMSSISSVLGGLGFGAYSAANFFMDIYIHHLNRTGKIRWISVNWDGWQLEEQQVQETPLGAVIAELAMTTEQGAQVFERVLAGENIKQVVQTSGDLQTRIDQWIMLEALEQQDKHEQRKTTTAMNQPRPHLTNPYVTPQTSLEKELAEIWKHLLGYDRVGTQDNFFELNGDSLKAVIVVSKIHKQLNIKIPLKDFFTEPTIEGLTRLIQGTRANQHEAIASIEKREYYRLSPVQDRMFLLKRLERESTAYNIPQVMELQGTPDRETFREIFCQLLRRHETLRTSFLLVKDEPMQRVHDEVEFEIEHQKVEVEVKVEDNDAEGTRGLAPLSVEIAERKAQSAERKEERHAPCAVRCASTIKNFIRPFDLSQAPLLRVRLMELPHTPAALRSHPSLKGKEHMYILMLDTHHIVSDGTSMGLLIKEFMQLYKNEALTPLVIQYKDYAAWQKVEQDSPRLKSQETYWLKQLEGDVPVMNLPLDFDRPVMWHFEGRQFWFELPSAETNALKELARGKQVTLYMVLVSIYTILLAKLTGQEDIIIGAPTAGRRHADLQNIFGMFINTLVLRHFPIEQKYYAQYLLELKTQILAAFENQDYPFDKLVEQKVVTREVGRNPLFDAAFVFQNMEIPTMEIPGLKLKPCVFEYPSTKLDLSLIAEEIGESLRFTVEYSTALFKHETIEQFSGFFREVVSSVLFNPGQKIADIEIITTKEKLKILREFNHPYIPFPREKTLHQLFAEQVEQTPDYIAVVGSTPLKYRTDKTYKTYISYRELNKKSHELAFMLREKGVGPDTIMAIMMERSPGLIIGLLAILKAGGAYLPIDPEYPQERVNYILRDSKVKILVIKSNIISYFNFGGHITVISIDEIIDKNRPQGTTYHLRLSRLVNEPVTTAPPSSTLILTSTCQVSPANLAYVIYTSGTTGWPKGVLIQHRGVVNLVMCHWNVFGENPRSCISQVSSLSFDAMAFEVWPCLLAGACLCIVDNETRMHPGQMKEWLIRHQVTISFQSTLMAAALLNEQWPGPGETEAALEVLRTAGDRLMHYPSHKYPFRFYNLYGPTEDTVWTTWTEVPVIQAPAERLKPPPIGKPVANHRVYILSRNSKLQPLGVTGELCVSGIGLARGYLNQPELTANRFDHDLWDYQDYQDKEGPFRQVLNAFGERQAHELHELTRIRTTSNEKFLQGGPGGTVFTKRVPPGRRRQNAYRSGDLARWLSDGNIEFLGRLDHQVKIRGYRIELQEIENQLLKHDVIREAVVVAQEQYLCAYIIVPDAKRKVQSPESLPKDLREYLSHTLPPYMIPSYFVFIDQIPVTSNGKIDRKALPAPQPGAGIEYIAPRNQEEEKLRKIWSEVLDKKIISINDNFFEIGGHSLNAAILNARIQKEFNVNLLLADFFAAPTIRETAERIMSADANKYIPLQPEEEKEYYYLSSAQKRLYLLRQMEPESIVYNMPAVLSLEGEPGKEKFQETFRLLIKRHESLRTSFEMLENEPVQKIHDQVEFEIEYKEVEVKVKVEDGDTEGTGGLAPLPVEITERKAQSAERKEERHAPCAVSCASTIKNFIRPFDLSQAPLLRVGLAKLLHTPTALRGHPSQEGKEDKYLLMVDMHHIISDGISHSVLIKDFFALYKGEPLPALKTQYKDFSRWQEQRRYSDEIRKQERYWLNKFAGEIPILNLKTDFPRGQTQNFEGEIFTFFIEKQKARDLTRLARKENTTMFMILLAVYCILLGKYTGQEDIVVGVPVFGRRHPDMQDIMGMFVNMLAMRNFPARDITFIQFLQEVKENSLSAFKNQDCQFEELVWKLDRKWEPGRQPLVDVVFNWQNQETLPQEMEIMGNNHSPIKIKTGKIDFKISKFDLLLWAGEKGDIIRCQLEYKTSLFKKETIRRMSKHIKKIITHILKNPAKKIAEIDIMEQEEKVRIIQKLRHNRHTQTWDRTANPGTKPGGKIEANFEF